MTTFDKLIYFKCICLVIDRKDTKKQKSLPHLTEQNKYIVKSYLIIYNFKICRLKYTLCIYICLPNEAH